MHPALTNIKLSADEAAPFRVAFANVFEKVVVHQTGKRRPVEVTPYARLSAIMGVDFIPKMRSPEKLFEEQGFANLLSATQGTLERAGW